MAKQKSKSKSKSKSTSSSPKEGQQERIVTMEALEELSDSDNENELPPESTWSTKAKSLKQAIQQGTFDSLIDKLQNNSNDDEHEHEEFEEDTLGSTEDENDDNDVDVEVDDVDGEEQEQENDDDEAEEEEEEQEVEQEEEAESSDDDDDDDDSDEEEDEEEDPSSAKSKKLSKDNHANSKALSVVTSELRAARAHMPWAESFAVIPETPLPFGTSSTETALDIHDDLKREVAFYNSSLQAVQEGRKLCQAAKVPFTRPDDFFAEMVKTDGTLLVGCVVLWIWILLVECVSFVMYIHFSHTFSSLWSTDHMSKVKDRLIFETKKMEAVAQRKSNREQKLRSKESHANKLAEKAKRKRDHFTQVEEWANEAAKNRGGALNDNANDDDEERYLRGKKRQNADRKYGFGGKRGRFKQNDRKSHNDVSGFNPRGNFPGMGTKKTAGGRNGSGAARQGKRARDAKRSRN